MEPIIYENSRVPKILGIFIEIWAITLYPFIFCEEEMDPFTLNHERIHFQQQKELWIVGFYVLYVYYWLKGKLKYKMNDRQAYLNIPFEIEAYSNDTDFEYLDSRPKHNWRKYKKFSE